MFFFQQSHSPFTALWKRSAPWTRLEVSTMACGDAAPRWRPTAMSSYLLAPLFTASYKLLYWDWVIPQKALPPRRYFPRKRHASRAVSVMLFASCPQGSVVIKNWKALSFEQISEDPLVTVGDILGELTTVATLRIQVFRGRPGVLADIKDKLLRFLLMQSHGLLMSAGCPLDEVGVAIARIDPRAVFTV